MISRPFVRMFSLPGWPVSSLELIMLLAGRFLDKALEYMVHFLGGRNGHRCVSQFWLEFGCPQCFAVPDVVEGAGRETPPSINSLNPEAMNSTHSPP